MHTNRRNWLKQMGLLSVGLGMAPLATIAGTLKKPKPSAPVDNSPVRLSSNENPYAPSPKALAAMTNSLTMSNRYNWNLTNDLISSIAKKNNLAVENVLIAPGSTVILDLVIQHFAPTKGSFVVADPSYTRWSKTAEKMGLRKISVPLDSDKRNNLPAMLAAIEADTKLVYICNPNNPTGTISDRQALFSFIQEATKKVTVMLDEAYIDYTDQASLSSMVPENKNLIIVKTFSKIYGLAGGRIGYALSNKETIDQIAQLQTWANGGISVVSRAAAMASMTDADFVKLSYSKNEEARKYTIDQLELLNISCIPSHTNFIYFSLANYKKDYFELLKSNNLLGTGIYEENGKWSRITVGTLEEMKKFIAALK